MLHVVYWNFIVAGLLLLFSGAMQIRNPRDQRYQALFITIFLTISEMLVNDVVLSLLERTSPKRYDLFVFSTEQALGLPSFHLGRLAVDHPWFGNTLQISYFLLPVAFMVLATCCFLLQPVEVAVRLPWTILFACLLVPLLYLVFPVAGPRYAISTFPVSAPAHLVPHVIFSHAIPTGVPSMHMTAALIFVYFARRWRIGVALASMYAALTVCSTMASGEHYFLDLVAAVPYTMLMIYVGAGKRADESTEMASVAPSKFSKMPAGA
jgi:hypothetical protein